MLTYLDWDTNHFGFRIGRVELPLHSIAELDLLLSEARRSEYKLIYVFWEATSEESSDWSLGESKGFREIFVDVRQTFSYELEKFSTSVDGLRNTSNNIAFEIQELDICDAGTELCELALVAGSNSRFFKDKQFPEIKSREMYLTWIEKCAKRVLADCVLHATDSTGKTIGFVTLTVKNGVGHIGLIAVDPAYQGVGLGSCLIAESHRRMLIAGATKSTVVTQGRNFSARKAYERNGYRLEKTEYVCHFWL